MPTLQELLSRVKSVHGDTASDALGGRNRGRFTIAGTTLALHKGLKHEGSRMSEKGNRTLLVKRFEAAETARKIASLEAVIRDFEALAAALSQQIATEEDRSKVSDPRRANYSMVAKASAARRSKLITSLVALRSKLEVAKREHVDVASEVRNLELALGVTSENANLAQIKHGKAAGRPL